MYFKSKTRPFHQSIHHAGVRHSKRMILMIPLLTAVLFIPSCNLILGLGMAKLHFGCLPEGTRIDTPQGRVGIENLEAGDTIIGFGGEPVQISQIHQYREDPATSRYVTIHFGNGAAVSASPRHRIEGVPASRLKPGDVCGSQTVTRIEPLRGVSRSFDLLTEDTGYRIAGIPVNSMIAEMAGRRETGSQ